MTQTLDEISLILIYSAMAVYALAFIAFALDLAKRSSEVKRQELGTAAGESAEVPVVTGVSTASGAVLNPASAGAVTAAPQRGTGRGSGATGATATAATVEKPKRSVPLRLGVSFTILGFLIQVVGVVLRGIAADRVPWANMYEFSITGTAIIVGVFLLVLLRQDLRFLGTFVLGLILILLGVATVNYYVPVSPLQPALQSAWLVIHVLVAIIGTAFFSLGGALSVMQLFQTRGDVLSRAATAMKLRFLRTMPDADTLERLAYRVNIVGFVLWTFTLIAGAIWAERAWGRYWGWDTKEVWTFIIWVIYAGYIHARATRGWRGSRSAWLAIIGFAAVLFNFGVVNVFFKGLHAYSGL